MPDSPDHMASQPSISLESGISAVIRHLPSSIFSMVWEASNGVSSSVLTAAGSVSSIVSRTLLTVFPV